MIEKLILLSRNTEIDVVSLRMMSAYANAELDSDVYLKNMFARLNTLSANLTTAINRSNVESILAKYDKERDKQIRSLAYLLNGLKHHPMPNVKEPALEVDHVFNKYGFSVTTKSYATKSSLIVSLLNDFKDSTLQHAINHLTGCAQIIAALETAQIEFEKSRVAYETEKAKVSTRASATSIKKEVVKLIKEKIVVYMRAMEIVEELKYSPFAITLNEIIADNNEVVKKRSEKTKKTTTKAMDNSPSKQQGLCFIVTISM